MIEPLVCVETDRVVRIDHDLRTKIRCLGPEVLRTATDGYRPCCVDCLWHGRELANTRALSAHERLEVEMSRG